MEQAQLQPQLQPQLQEPQHNPSLKGVVGIQNMGNTCYCNTTLQLIRSCPEWNAYCLTQDFAEQLKDIPEGDSNKRILLAYQDITRAIWSAYKPAYVRPLGFISEVRKAVQGTVYEMFGMPIPNDSHEYLVYLLDHFHEAIKKEVPFHKITPSDSATPAERMRILAQNGWNEFVSKNTSEIVNLFFGMMRKTVECQSCHNKTYQWEVFNSLKVPCDGQHFKDWIRGEVNESTDIDGYRCDTCKTQTAAKKSSHLWRLPPCLFVTLRRFYYTGQKNMTVCPYKGTIISFEEFFADEVEDKISNYELRGVSDHHGTHMGGHYTAQFKHPISNEWWWMDDESARLEEKPQFSASNYIFFFRKTQTA